MEKYNVIIIGAGISGLSLAHYCKKEGLKTLVIEKDIRVGGALHSHYFQGIGFWIELGAHTCYNTYGNLIGIIEDCSAVNKIIKREKVPFKMLLNGEIKSISSQLNLLELFCSAPKILLLKKEEMRVKEYYSKVVGRKNFEKVISPAINAVISQNADDFPASLLFKRRPRRKDIIRKFTFEKGLQAIADSIASQKGIDVLTGQKIISIRHKNRHFEIVSEEGSYASEYLAIATQASSAAGLLKELYPEVSEKLSHIRVEKVESVGVAVKRADVESIPPVAGIIPSSDIFYSIVSRDTVRDNAYRGFTFHFKPNLANDKEKLKRISEVLRIKEKGIEYFIEKQNFVPSLKRGHDALIQSINQLISDKPIFLTGNYFDGLAIEDCVSRSYMEFLRLKAMFGH